MAQLSHSRLLFAAKHYGVARKSGIRAALALDHLIRIAVFGAVAVARPAQLERVRAERAGLRVTLGLSAPPLGPYSKSAVRRPDPRPTATTSRSDTATRTLPQRPRSPRPPTTRVKPLLPRRLQIAMRRLYAKRQARTEFPAGRSSRSSSTAGVPSCARRWTRARGEPMPVIANWPEGRRFAAILTHDVEGPAGIANMPRVLEIERRHGFVSSGTSSPRATRSRTACFDHSAPRAARSGCTAIKHDCKLFASRARFEAELPEIHRYLAEWDAVGFRSPATHRNADWMPELGALYDSSFPDTDPFEPQAGGCCSILPYFLGRPGRAADHAGPGPHAVGDPAPGHDRPLDAQERLDHRQRRADQPDHAPRLPRHAGTAPHVRGIPRVPGRPTEGWHTLPREVAAWWHTRSGLRCIEDGGGAHIEGEGAERATIAWARPSATDVDARARASRV